MITCKLQTLDLDKVGKFYHIYEMNSNQFTSVKEAYEKSTGEIKALEKLAPLLR